MGTYPNEVEGNMQLEHIIQNKVMVELSEAGFTPYRMVVGTYYTKTLNPIPIPPPITTTFRLCTGGVSYLHSSSRPVVGLIAQPYCPVVISWLKQV